MPFSICPLFGTEPFFSPVHSLGYFPFSRCLQTRILSGNFRPSNYMSFPLAVIYISRNPFFLSCPPYRVHYNSGEDYNQLKPLVQIDILDFELYENSKEFYSTYHLANDKNHRIYSDKLTLHVLELNTEEYATEEDKSYGIDYWARLFKSTTWEELKALAMEQNNLQSTVEAIYRVNADEQASDELFAREDFLRNQRTQQNQMKRKDDTIAEQANTIAEQANTIAEQANTIVEQTNTIAEQAAKIAKLEAKFAALNK